MVTVLANCTALNESAYQGMQSGWYINPDTHHVEASIVPDGTTLPNGATLTTWKTANGISGGACILTRPPLDTVTGNRWVWGQYNLLDWFGATIDLSSNALLKVRLYTNHPEVPVRFGIFTSPWTGYGYATPALAANVWNEIGYDLRLSAEGLVPDLTLFRTLSLTVAEDGIPQEIANDYFLLIDYIAVEPATAPIRLQATISPKEGRLKTAQTLGITCNAAGGTGNYVFKWYVNGALTTVATPTYMFVASNAGTYLVHAVITDGVETVTTADATIVVIAQLPPPIPTRPLHCEGRLVKDDMGKIVRLQGIMPATWLSGPNKDTFGVDGRMHFSADYTNFADELPVIQEEIDGLREWGANIVRHHISVYLWLTNLGGYRDNIKTYCQMLAANGIYCVICGYSINYYEQGLYATTIPYPPHLSASDTSALSAAGVTWTSSQDFANWVVSVADFLKDCNNVLIETWNEPNADSGAEPWQQAKATWIATVQQIVTQMRNSGLTMPVVVQWNYGTNYTFGTDNSQYYSMDYAPITDPLNNIIYSTHSYRDYMQLGGWWTGSWATRQCAYKYADIKQVYAEHGVLAMAQNHPVLIGEIGGNSTSPRPANDGTDPLEDEKQALTNALQLYRENGLHWIGFWLRPDGTHAMVQANAPNYVPTIMGTIMQKELVSTSPTPFPLWIPLLIGAGAVVYLGVKK